MRLDSEKKTYFITSFAFWLLLFTHLYLFILGGLIWALAVNRWAPDFIFLVCMLLALIFIRIYGLKQFSTMTGKLCIIILLLGEGVLITYYWLLPEKTWCIDVPAYNQILGITCIVSDLIAIILNIILIIQKRIIQNPLPKSYKIKMGGIFILILFIMISSAFNFYDPYYYATVPAENEAPPTRFSFWGHLNLSEYTQDQLQMLNNHHSIIVAYEYFPPGTVYSEISPIDFEVARNNTYLWVQNLRDNYTSIEIMFPLFGSYYQLETKSYSVMLQEYLDAIQYYDLTNVIGFNIDLERHNDTCAHNQKLLESARIDLKKCIDMIHEFNPNYRIDNTGGIWMMFDELPLGGSYELYRQHALMSIEGWDHYAWQLYRGNAVDPASDPESTNTFERISSSCEFLGKETTVPLFGMTGVGDYGPNNCSKNNERCNFNGVIYDCKLSRALGVKEVQFYTLTSAGTWQGVYYPSMFEAYGDSFLDELNQSVNGLQKSETLKIPGRTLFRSTLGYWLEDVVYSISGWTVLIIIGLAFLMAIILFKPRFI